MKTRNIILYVALMMLLGMASCAKDPAIPTGKVFGTADNNGSIDDGGNDNETYTISVSANPTNGGMVSGGGDYEYNNSCTVTATPNTNSHYHFVNWTENGTVVSENLSYTFDVTSDRSLVANFALDTYLIRVFADPTAGGTVQIMSGGTSYGTSHSFTYGTTIQLEATPNNGYSFTNWKEGNTVIATIATASSIIVDDAHDYTAYFSYNGGGTHEYVDLGLPSGLLWATCNVGADNPEDYGDYFAWGETQPKDYYDWNTYQYSNGVTSWQNPILTKYCNNADYGYNGFTDNLTTLEPSDDAATANADWGNGWRMPTQAEWNELLNNTTNTWTTRNGVNGRLFTASNGNSLFLPAAGYRYGGSLYDAGSYGAYLSSSLFTHDPNYAWALGFDSVSCGMGSNGRGSGQSVRAVRASGQN